MLSWLEATTVNRNWNTWQLFANLTVISVAVHFALPYMPFVWKPLYTWLLRRLVAWGDANGIDVD